ncbi:MAG: hypothetical protein PHE79_11835 [Eubacteriales bacterium]|nr:hypothetical protein [Eubacteriales bacterium]
MPQLANTSQMEIAKVAKIGDVLSISHNPIMNQLGLYAFDEIQHFPGGDYPYTAAGSQSFSIEVDGDCSIYFDEEISGVWTALDGTYSLDGGEATAFSGSITVSGISDDALQKFVNYRGLLTIASTSNNVRIKVVPVYPMKSRYRALFAYLYPNAIKVPHCTAYISYDLPANYMEFNKMMRAFDQRQFDENKDYKLTPDNKIHINWFLTGQFDIHYWKFPTVIDDSTEDTYTFEVRTDAQSAIPWFMAGMAIYPTNKKLGNRLVQQYYALVGNMDTAKTSTSAEIQSSLWAASRPTKLIDQIRT